MSSSSMMMMMMVNNNNNNNNMSTLTTAVTRPKQVIKDYCRQKHYKGPIYYLTHEEKVDLHKHYTVQLWINDNFNAKGIGLSRRNAEFKAALEAIQLFHENDPSILELIKQSNDRSFGSLRRRRPINRSFSVDYISNANRADSFASMANGHYDANDGRQSVTPSMDGIDSITLKSDYSNVMALSNNVIDKSKDNFHHNHHETSSDEGVCTEESECSNSALPSPKLNNHRQTKDLKRNSYNNDNTKRSFSFLPSSLMLLSSLRDFSRRSFRRSKSLSNNGRRKTETDNEPSSTASTISASSSLSSSSSSTTTPRPISSSSSSSSSSTSAFSSDSSISSTHQTIHNNAKDHHNDFGEPQIMATTSMIIPMNEEAAIIHSNHYQSSNIIVESIIEEEEEEVEQSNNDENNNNNNKNNNKQSSLLSINRSLLFNNGSNKRIDRIDHNQNGIIRSYSSSLLSQQHVCPHNHFSIYGPILCNSTENCSTLHSHHRETIETSPTAILLKYCIRMYLPLPYYDIHFDQKFMVTCRVIMSIESSTNNNNNDQQQQQQHRNPKRTIPEQYIDHQFTAKGHGEILREARNMAAKLVINKLTVAGLFHDE
nr:uncharacterized protein DDB_G0271670-like [Dermatophagoides farinae]